MISLEPRRALESVFRKETWSVDIVALCPSLCKWSGNLAALRRLAEEATGADHVLIGAEAVAGRDSSHFLMPILEAMSLLAALRNCWMPRTVGMARKAAEQASGSGTCRSSAFPGDRPQARAARHD